MDNLLKLAERCEQAEGPDRLLDAAIVLALNGYTLHEDTDPASGHFAFWEGEPWKSICYNCSSWLECTASIDAALTLLDEDTFFHVSCYPLDHAPMRGEAHVYPNRFVGDDYKGEAATPALALCAAALRARHTIQDQVP